ncbi:TRAP transporter substrate-binding protein [Paenalcaligenes niemegkensis]|uniref:TRAP transporter substrate-binding protein n=1 Tax=Paenalcaligenes niemegkensis TaxID=2895469 RepID=UPI001EE8F264|nr:TRAP transporter substrate-binding protein [Paenalcaligenes niemegkensis]MCQ9618047.1 TRAP transporter substrate-binding protein [Paenalcaligenes niemegkensis]
MLNSANTRSIAHVRSLNVPLHYVQAWVVTIGMGLSGQAYAATEWIAVTPWPQNNYHAVNLQTFANKVKEVTGGEVTIRVHTGGDLGLKGPELLNATRDGIVQISDMLLTQQVGEEPLLGLESVPYLTRSFEELAILQKHVKPYYHEIAGENNQKFLYFTPWPGQGLFSKTEVTDLADMKNMKVRTVEKNGTDFFNAMDAIAIQMPWGEVIPGLASGAIQGVSTSSPSATDGKFWEFIDYYNRFNWQSASQAVSVNLDAWEALTSTQREQIENIAAELQPLFWEIAQNEDSANIARLQESGMTVTLPSETLSQQLTEAAEPLWGEFIKRVGGPAQSIIDDYRQEANR